MENKKMKINNGEEGRDEDRLSSLPDSILITILSLLPTKSAITSSVLSRRWRCLWTQIVSLEFNINHFKEKDHSSVFTIINHVLNQITSPCFVKFSLHLNNRCFFGLKFLDSSGSVTYLQSWLHQLSGQNVEQFQINQVEQSATVTLQYSYLKLPPYVFQTSSLTVIELGRVFCCLLPTYDDDDDYRIHLPNLKKLSIFLAERCSEAFSKLIRSCPSLEDLIFWIEQLHMLNYEHLYIDISSQSLKQLDMSLPKCSKDAKVVINAPKLVKLNVYCFNSLEIIFATNPIALLEARIKITSLLCSPNESITKLFRGISSVRSLVLYTCLQLNGLVRFPNLTHLTLPMLSFRGFKQLFTSLESYPVLEVLILKILRFRMENRLMPPTSAPACLSTHVKRIEIVVYETRSDGILLLLVEYLLSSALVMEQLIISITKSLEHQYDQVGCSKEKQLCEQLYNFPRRLLRCQIVFSGIYFEARVPNGSIVKLCPPEGVS